MEKNCQIFVDSLTSLSKNLKACSDKCIEYWSPDQPPITIIFGDLGCQIVDDFDKVEMHLNRQVFALIEDAMTSGGDSLSTAVATGTLEAMAGRAARKQGLWQRISPTLGVSSRRHLEAWMAS